MINDSVGLIRRNLVGANSEFLTIPVPVLTN
jgi:hypothetical protein